MSTKDRFNVTLYTNPSGAQVCREGRMPDGRQVRRNFRRKEEAVGYKGELEVEALNETVRVRLKQTRLTDDQLADAEVAVHRLEGTGHTLVFAVDYLQRNWRPALVPRSVLDAYHEFIADKEGQKVRPRTMTDYRSRIGRLAKKYSTKLANEITTADLKALITAPGRAPRTFNGNRRVLHGFFEWCRKHDYCTENPVVRIEPANVDHVSPPIPTLDEVKSLLRAALAYKSGLLAPYFSLAFFSGLRPTELARITWEHIDLTQSLLTVDGPAAKLRQRRVVELPDNLSHWLLPHRDKPIVGQNWRRDFDAVRRVCGFKTKLKQSERSNASLKDWPDDVLRHTAVSHHLAKHQHEGKTAVWAGNSADVVQRHYKALVKPGEATEYWSLLPSNVSGHVVGFPAAA